MVGLVVAGPRDEPMLRHEWLRAWIENFTPGATLRTFVARTGKEIHVQGTPLFLINGTKMMGAQPIEKMRAAIDQALADANAK